MRESKRRGRHINLLVIVLPVVFYLGTAGTAEYYILTYSREAEARTTPESLVAKGSVKTGTLNDPEKRQQESNNVVREGMIIFSINATPFVTDGKGKANLMVGNPSDNGRRFTVIIQRDDTGGMIYRSGYLNPEQYIDEVPLDVELAKGEYAYAAYFDAYRLSDDSYIGRTGVRVTLCVLEWWAGPWSKCRKWRWTTNVNSTAEETGEGRNIPIQRGPGQEEYEHGSDIRSDTRKKTPSQGHSKPQTCKTDSSSPTRQGAVTVICLCCMAEAGTGGYFFYQANAPELASGLHYESSIVSGNIPGKTREGHQQELNSVVEEGILDVSMNVTPSGWVSGTAAERSINWLIESPSNQGKLIRVEVIRDNTGKKIYETGAIRPGNYVELAPLGVRPPAGEYAYTAVFFAYQEDTETLIGQTAMKIRLTLQE